MKGMSNNQIIQNEAAKLAPATLHAIATAHHTAAQIEALAAQITVTEDDGTQHPAPPTTRRSCWQPASCTPSTTGRRKARASSSTKRHC